jgi:hypothetical protein
MDLTEQRRNLEHFGELVLADRDLHERLRAADGVKAFVALTVELGGERGCVFTTPVVEAALQERRRVWLERWF